MEGEVLSVDLGNIYDSSRRQSFSKAAGGDLIWIDSPIVQNQGNNSCNRLSSKRGSIHGSMTSDISYKSIMNKMREEKKSPSNIENEIFSPFGGTPSAIIKSSPSSLKGFSQVKFKIYYKN